jgi:chaperonin GroEL (HSP60 family)
MVWIKCLISSLGDATITNDASKAVTILVRGGSQKVVDESERSIHDALMVTKDVLERPEIMAGGGATEAYVGNELRG